MPLSVDLVNDGKGLRPYLTNLGYTRARQDGDRPAIQQETRGTGDGHADRGSVQIAVSCLRNRDTVPIRSRRSRAAKWSLADRGGWRSAAR